MPIDSSRTPDAPPPPPPPPVASRAEHKAEALDRRAAQQAAERSEQPIDRSADGRAIPAQTDARPTSTERRAELLDQAIERRHSGSPAPHEAGVPQPDHPVGIEPEVQAAAAPPPPPGGDEGGLPPRPPKVPVEHERSRPPPEDTGAPPDATSVTPAEAQGRAEISSENEDGRNSEVSRADPPSAEAAGGGSTDAPTGQERRVADDRSIAGTPADIPVGGEPDVTGPAGNVDGVKAVAVDKKPTYSDPARKPVPGDYCGSSQYRNYEGKLPQKDGGGNPVTYLEYDRDPYDGNRRNARRFVVGSDGAHYHTDDHYRSWTRFR